MAVDDDTAAVLRSLGANVRRLRTQRKLTQAKLAAVIEREVNYLQKIEYGTAAPSIALVVHLARALDVPVARLFRVARPTARKPGRPRKRRPATPRRGD